MNNNYLLDIKKIINKYDPAGLFVLGAPEDEYSNEINLINSLLIEKKFTSSIDLEDALKVLFSSRFSPITVENNVSVYHSIAEDLFKLVGNYGILWKKNIKK